VAAEIVVAELGREVTTGDNSKGSRTNGATINNRINNGPTINNKTSNWPTVNSSNNNLSNGPTTTQIGVKTNPKPHPNCQHTSGVKTLAHLLECVTMVVDERTRLHNNEQNACAQPNRNRVNKSSDTLHQHWPARSQPM